MDSVSLENLTKEFIFGTRRRAIAGLAALALGGAGVFSQALDSSASARKRCINRCVGHIGPGGKLQKKRHRCRAKCANRNG